MVNRLAQGQEKQVKRVALKTVRAGERKALAKGKEEGQEERNQEQERQTDTCRRDHSGLFCC